MCFCKVQSNTTLYKVNEDAKLGQFDGVCGKFEMLTRNINFLYSNIALNAYSMDQSFSLANRSVNEKEESMSSISKF